MKDESSSSKATGSSKTYFPLFNRTAGNVGDAKEPEEKEPKKSATQSKIVEKKVTEVKEKKKADPNSKGEPKTVEKKVKEVKEKKKAEPKTAKEVKEKKTAEPKTVGKKGPTKRKATSPVNAVPAVKRNRSSSIVSDSESKNDFNASKIVSQMSSASLRHADSVLMEVDQKIRQACQLTKKDLKKESTAIKQEVPKKVYEREVVEKPERLQLWVDKHAPADVKAMVGQQTPKSPMNRLLTWLEEWASNNLYEQTDSKKKSVKKDDGAGFKAALLSGPPGIGKTTTAMLVCKKLGLKYVEKNASDSRSKKMLNSGIGDSLLYTKIDSFFGKNKDVGMHSKSVTHVLIMDEVDGMSGNEDRGGMSELISMIKNSKVPVICICNDRFNRKISSLANHCLDLRYTKPTEMQIRGRLLAIANQEGVTITPDQAADLVKAANMDIRQAIYNLQLMKSKVNTQNLSRKNDTMGIFGAAEKMMQNNLPLHERAGLFFTDYSIMPLFMQENYLSIIPDNKNRKETMASIFKAAASLSDGEIISRSIRKTQDWSLLPIEGLFSVVLPPIYMNGTVASRVIFPSHLGKISSRNKYFRIAKEITRHISSKINVDIFSLITEYAPIIRRMIAKHLISGGAAAIPDVIQIFDDYAMIKDDYEGMIELEIGDEAQDLEKRIPAAVKSGLTRALNKDRIALPYSNINSDVVKSTKTKMKGKAKKEKIADDPFLVEEDEEMVEELNEYDL
uniref:AAA domain-containing protein n=1 Tax=Rhabditophanes sp. KR3021 TaxID=114890 RepID=A0AC35U4G8_9BILA